MSRIDDCVDPEPCRGVARVSLVFICGADGLMQFLLVRVSELLAFAFELLDFDFDKRAGSGIAAHDRIPRGRPRKNEPWIVRFAAHRVVASPKAATANHRDFWDYAIRDGV